MQDSPPPALLIDQVRRALEAGLAPGFEQKVAANALGIALRELADRPASDAAELERLAALVPGAGSLAQANAALAAALREGAWALDDRALVEHLIRTTLAKIAVDQPAYPAFRAWRDGAPVAPADPSD